MKNPRLILTLLIAFVLAPSVFADKTDLADDKYVENSEFDFKLEAKEIAGNRAKTRVFELSAPQSGNYTLICFVDGHFFKREAIELPGRYSLSARGLSAGAHKITLQVVDANGRVGGARVEITVEK